MEQQGEPKRQKTMTSEQVLNVGGTPFTASISTLTSRFAQGTWFGPRFSGIYNDAVDGCVFIDGNPKYFPLVLAFLRDGWCALPENLSELRQLRQDAEFYNLAGLLTLIDQTCSMRLFYLEVRLGSPEGDDFAEHMYMLAKPCDESKVYRLMSTSAAYQTASEQERVAARTQIHHLQVEMDVLVLRNMRGHRTADKIQVAIPASDARSNIRDCAGVYKRLKGVSANGFPVWRAETLAKHWLFTDTGGQWAINAESFCPLIGIGKTFNTKEVLVVGHAGRFHGGKCPCDEEIWRCSNGERLVEDNNISVTALP